MLFPGVCFLGNSLCENSGGTGEAGRRGRPAWGEVKGTPQSRLLEQTPLVYGAHGPAVLWPTWLTSSGIPRALSISSRPSKFRKAIYSWSRRAPSSLGDSAAGCGHSRSSGELPNGCLQRDRVHHGWWRRQLTSRVSAVNSHQPNTEQSQHFW